MSDIQTLKEMNPIAYDELVDIFDPYFGNSILDQKDEISSDSCCLVSQPIGKFRCSNGKHPDYYALLGSRFFSDFFIARGYKDEGCPACYLESQGYLLLKTFLHYTHDRVILYAMVYCPDCKTIVDAKDVYLNTYKCSCKTEDKLNVSTRTIKSMFPRWAAEMDAADNFIKSDMLSYASLRTKIYVDDDEEEEESILFNFNCADCGEIYKSQLSFYRFNSNNTICPYCNGKYAHYDQSIAKMYPKAARQYHKSNRFPVNKVFGTDTSKVYTFKCERCGIIRNVSIQNILDDNCEICNNGFTREEVERHFKERLDYELISKNDTLINIRSKTHSYYKCLECNNLYSNTEYSYFYEGKSCPYCAGKYAIPGKTSFKALYGDLVNKYWTNGNPDSILPTNSERRQFSCSVCKGEFFCSVKEIVEMYNSGIEICPYCDNRRVLPGFNSFKALKPSIVETYWDYTNNDVNPDEIVISGTIRYNFRCPNCSGKFTSFLKDFIDKYENGEEVCPYCANKRVLPGFNSFKALKPDIVETYWDFDNNYVNPDEILINSSWRFEFRCPKCTGTFNSLISTIIDDYENNREVCPYCDDRKVLPGLNSIKALCPDVMKEWDLINNTLDPDTLGTKSSAFAYFKCSECKKIYTSTIKTKILNDKRQIKSCSFCKGYRIKKIHYF